MCGIFGYVGKVPAASQESVYTLISKLAEASECRGVDATGFSARWGPDIISVDKAPMKASHFIKYSHKFQKMRTNMPTTFIGHTRLGTGSSPIINNNNHPFLGSAFNMVHNGIIPNWKEIAEKNKLPMSSETDSEIVLRLIEKIMGEGKPLREAVEWILNNVWGNMAIALMDKKTPYIYLFRNENPIWYFCPPSKLLPEVRFFASTKEIFEKAWLDTFKTKLNEAGVESKLMDDNKLYQINAYPGYTTDKIRTQKFYHPLKIENKFKKKKTYWSSSIYGMESDVDGRTFEGEKLVRVYSLFGDTADPSAPPQISEKGVEILKASVNKTVMIDGLPIQQFNDIDEILKSLQTHANA